MSTLIPLLQSLRLSQLDNVLVESALGAARDKLAQLNQVFVVPEIVLDQEPLPTSPGFTPVPTLASYKDRLNLVTPPAEIPNSLSEILHEIETVPEFTPLDQDQLYREMPEPDQDKYLANIGLFCKRLGQLRAMVQTGTADRTGLCRVLDDVWGHGVILAELNALHEQFFMTVLDKVLCYFGVLLFRTVPDDADTVSVMKKYQSHVLLVLDGFQRASINNYYRFQ